MGKALELAIGALNGAIGDWLARTDNGLATPMECFVGGRPVPVRTDALAAAHPAARSHLVVLVHGLMCTESIWQWPDGSDYGSLLARDLEATPIYVRYNSGLAIPDNGAALDRLLTELHDAWPVPVESIVPIGYSMGGLVVRSATHVASLAGHTWLGKVRRAIYVGTPHLGAPLERVGRVATRLLRAIPDPVTRLVADVADLRSDGVKDLGDADLRHEDRARRAPRFALRDPRHPVPLLASIQHHLVAGSLSADPRVAALFGDSVVPLPSGTDGACIDPDSIAFPPEHVSFLPGLSHMALAHHPSVYDRIRSWCTSERGDA
jgi:triacylglycerol lipase